MTIGIDLGTTNSCAAYVKDGQATVIENAEGQRTTPSVITFRRNGDAYIGLDAKRRRVQDPLDTVWSAKRFMGRSYSSVKKELKGLPYRFTCDRDDNVCICVAGRNMTVPEVAAQILNKIRVDSRNALGKEIDSAVITVPAYFSDTQREATRLAGRLAGLDVKRIISEPTAAALAYGMEHGDGNIAVYDLGGGTFDISILEIRDGNVKVLSTAGDNMLGGDDIDRRISDWIIRKAIPQVGADISRDAEEPSTANIAVYALQKVRDAAEKAKIELSEKDKTEICIPNLYRERDFKAALTAEDLGQKKRPNHLGQAFADDWT